MSLLLVLCHACVASTDADPCSLPIESPLHFRQRLSSAPIDSCNSSPSDKHSVGMPRTTSALTPRDRTRLRPVRFASATQFPVDNAMTMRNLSSGNISTLFSNCLDIETPYHHPNCLFNPSFKIQLTCAIDSSIPPALGYGAHTKR